MVKTGNNYCRGRWVGNGSAHACISFKMASPRKCVRYTFDVHFITLEEKEVFQQRLKNVRELLTPSGGLTIGEATIS